MPILSFQVQADYEKVMRLREEIRKLKEEMKGVDAVSNSQQFNTINQKIKQRVDEYNKLTEVAAKAGSQIGVASRKQIYDAQQAVNSFTEDIIKQKNIIADTSDKLKVLTDKYKDLKRNGQNIAANSMLPDISKAKKALDEEKFALFDLTQERAKAQLGVKKLREEYALFTKESGASTSILAKMKSEIMGLGAGMLAGFGLKELGAEIIRVRGQFQQADTAIQTMLGNKEKADALLSKVREYAKISPLEFGDITRATQMMLGFNIEAEKVPGFIEAIGDVSMGESSRFNSLTLAFSQMSATGKLMGQDLNQMINAGFNPLQVMSEKTGKSIVQLKEEMSKGAISAEMVQQAFIDATSAGGKFYNMSQNAAKTINGQLSIMHDAIDSALNDIGKNSEGVIVGAISGVTKLIEDYETLGRVLMGLTATYGAYRTAVALVTFAENGHTLAMTLARAQILLTQKAQALLNTTMLANPYVLAATAIAGLVSALVLYKNSADEAELANERLNKSFGITQAEISSEQKKIDELFDKLRKAEVGTNEYKDVKDAILKQYGSYLEGLSNEIATLKDVEGAYKAVAAAARDAALARGREAAIASANSEYNQKYSEYIGKIYDQLIKKGFNEDDTKRMLGWIQGDLKKTGKVAEDTQRALHKYGVEFSWFGELNKAEQGLTYETQKINAMFGEQGKVVDNTSKKVSKLSDDYKAAEKSFRNAKNWLSQIEKNKSDYTTEEYKNALQDYEKKKQAFKDVGGDPDKKKNGGGRTGTKQDIAERVKELNDKQITAQLRAAKDLEFSTREAEIKAMEEGNAKVLAQIKLDRDREYEAIERAYADLKQKRIDEAKQLWEANPANKGKNFFDSDEFKQAASDDRYTDEERANRVAKRKAADAEYLRSIDNVKKEELQAMYDYLKEYGTFQEQKLAITREYEEKIAKEQDPSRKATLMMQRDRDLENLSSEQAKQQINWDDIFTDLRGHTTDYLEGLRSQLQSLIGSGTLKLDELEVAQGKIRDINALISEQSGLFSFIGPLQIEYNRRLQEEAGAKELLEKAKAEQSSQEAAVSMMKVSLSDFLSSRGQPVSGEINGDIKNPFKENSADWKKFNDMIAKLRAGESKLADARSKTASATQKAKNAEDGTKTTTKEKWERFLDTKAVKTSMANLSSAPELLNNLGLGDAGEKAQKGLDGMNDAMGAVTDYMSGNYIGALSKGISAVTNFGEALGLWSSSNRAEVEAANEKLQIATDVNTEAINRLTDAMKSQSPMEAVKSWEQARKMMELNERNRQQTMANNAGMYDGGHSLWYDFNDEYGDRFIRELYRLVGKQSWDGSYDIGSAVHDFSGEDWNKLLREYPEKMTQLGQMIADVEDEGNYNGMFQDILDLAKEYSKEAYDELKNTLNESITGVSFDSFKDKFKSSLMDMKKDAKGFSEDFTEMLMQSVLDAKIEDLYGKEMSDLYDQWVSALSDNSLSKEEIKKLQGQQDDLVQRMMATRDMLAAATGYDSSERSDQTATASMAEKATYDQFDTYLGIATAQQIALEQIRDALGGMTGEGFTLVNMTLEQMIAIGTSVRDIATENQDIFAQSLIELREANDHLGKIEKSVDRIETSVSKTEHLINDRL